MEPTATTIRDRSLASVRVLVLDHLREEDVAIYLFGSHARGDAHAGSDIDVGVLPRAALEHGRLANLRERLEDLPIPYRVEIVNLAETSDALRRNARKEAITWRP